MKSLTTKVTFLVVTLSALSASATPVTLQNPVGTFSQGGLNVAATIDGTFSGLNGWAIDPQEGHDQTAAYQTVSDIGDPKGTRLTFTLYNDFLTGPGHVLGDFRISVTTAPRSSFATNAQQGPNNPDTLNPAAGDVGSDAIWTQLAPLTAVATHNITLTIEPNNSILASGTPTVSDFTVTAITNLTGITGIRLEALTDPSLPHNGPGMQTNGNFVLDEFTVDAVALPEPSTWVLLVLGTVGLVALGCRQRNAISSRFAQRSLPIVR